MPWLRLGDNAATHPALMALAAVRGADERTVNEAFGFLVRLSTQSAAHLTDYRVGWPTAQMLGGQRAETLLKLCVRAGLLIQHGSGQNRSWSIVEDDDFIHMMKKAAVLRKRQGTNDSRNESLTVPVRLRDGDECRYCGRIVNWYDRKGIGGGQYDHMEPGKPATIETFVVACAGCNKSLSNTEYSERLDYLRPAPTQPFYSPSSADWLTKRGRPTRPTTAQSESERAGAAGPESTSGSPTATARPHGHDTAAHPARETPTGDSTAATARDGSTDPSTAATVRDRGHGAPQPPARATPWSEATAATTARPDFLSDPAATAQRDPDPMHPDPAPARRMNEAPLAAQPEPPEGLPRPNQDQQVTNRSDVSQPGRVGTGRVGSGAAGGQPVRPASGSSLPGGSASSSPPRRGRRARRSKKG